MAEATHSFDGERFTVIRTGKVSAIHASQKRGRWYFRDGDAKGTLYASGVTPAEFVKRFWYGTLAEDS